MRRDRRRGRLCRKPTPSNDEAFWGVACDILIPAALEGQITLATTPTDPGAMVLEGANGPTTRGRRHPADKGIWWCLT